MSNAVELGKNIVILRGVRRLSQEELAGLADISVGWLRDIEHDCANATRDVVERIAQALGVLVWVLYALQSEPDSVRDELNEIQALLKPSRKAVLA